ncbi:sensor histidine kinase [Kineosporia succinea]
MATGALVTVGMLLSVFLYRSVATVDNDALLRMPITESVLWSLAVALPLCLRRRYPIVVLLTVSAMFIGMQSRVVIEGTMSSISLFCALYTAGAWGRDRRITNAARVIVVVVMFCWLAYAISATAWAEVGDDLQGDGPIPAHLANILYLTLFNVLFFAAAWYFGDASWRQARQQEQLRERTLELARERDESARRAVLAERVRIARELHDVVAHNVSLMGVQAGAARRVLDRDPELTRQTLGVIEEAGRSAVEEMRRLLVVLRDSDDRSPDQPSPGVDALPQLLEQASTPGTATHFTVVGEPVPLTVALSVSVYRIAQEALTNSLKHAGASRIDARLRYLDEAVELEMVDDGRGNGHTGSRGSGLGQVGMRERVDLHGGTLDLGRRPEGGYRVRARLPLVRTVTQ